MNENINLCETLKGHEGETFYSPICGTIVLLRINSDGGIIFKSLLDPCVPYAFNEDGTFISGAECVIFPSKDQRDWNKWIEEQKPKVPKTWSELICEHKIENCHIEIKKGFHSEDKTLCGSTPIEKSALALLKIHQLIEVGYGGNVTSDYIRKMPTYEKVWGIYYNFNVKRFETKCSIESIDNTILFHTKEQAEEFLKYPENVQLLKDYFTI